MNKLSLPPLRVILTAIAAGLVIGLPSPAARAQQAAPFTQLVVFGDSLSDDGNIASRAEADYGLRFPGPLFNYTDGRFTDGPDTAPSARKYAGVWHEQLAALFGGLKPATDSEDGGSDYAFGAATTMDGSTTISDGSLDLTVDNMGKQVGDYLAAHTPDPHALYLVWGGGNDLYADDSAAGVSGAAQRVAALVTKLGLAGARAVLVPNLPPLGDVPGQAGDPATIAALDQAAADYNTQLNTALDAAQSAFAAQKVTVKVFRLDVAGVFAGMAKNPAAFGFADITDSAQGLSVNPDQYLFWDGLHPTTAGHYQIALAAYNLLVSGTDTTPPVTAAALSPAAPNGTGGFYTVPVTITLAASDAGSGVASTVYALDGAAAKAYTAPLVVATDGAHTLSFHSTDKAGNAEAVRSVAFKVDRTKPVTTAAVLKTTAGDQITLSATDNLSGVASRYYSLDGGTQTLYTAPVVVSRNGSHSLSYHSADKAGNVETTRTTAFTTAVALPVTSVTLAGTLGTGGYYKSAVTVVLSAKAGGVAVAHEFYSLDGGPQQTYLGAFAVTPDGVHTLSYHSADKAGNVEAAKSVTFKIDKTKPVTSSALLKTPTGEKVTLSATDALSGVASTVYAVDNGAAKTYSAPFTVSGKGAHTVTYHSTDKAGNVEAIKTTLITNPA